MTMIKIAARSYLRGVATDEVDAEVIGELAFHRSIGIHRWSEKYSITHVRTGFRCMGASSKKQARDAIKALLALPVDWAFTNPETVKGWHEKHGDALRDIRRRAEA
jgi:hypothetical protein